MKLYYIELYYLDLDKKNFLIENFLINLEDTKKKKKIISKLINDLTSVVDIKHIYSFH